MFLFSSFRHTMNTTRSSCWSLTIANPTAKTEEEIALARQGGWEVVGQLEEGEGGLKHYQLMLKTPQVRFSAVKKSFSTAHIEVARNPKALGLYVEKTETRVGTLPQQQSMYPSLSKFWILVSDFVNDKNYLHCDADRWWTKESGRKDALTILDEAVEELIDLGYMVEGIACNPSTRSAWKKYHFAILRRSHKILQQTDRQTDTALETEQTVTVPTTNEASLREDVSLSGTDDEEASDEEDEDSESDPSSDESDQESDSF